MQSRYERILYSTILRLCQEEYYHCRNPMYVSFLLCKRHRHFSVLERISFFLSKWQQIAIRWDLARTPSRPSALVFGLMTTDINVAMLWRVVHKFIKRVNKVRLKTFVPYNLFHTKFSAIVAIIRWTMLLEKVFHLPQPQFFFGFASEQAESCCEESTFRY